MTAGMAKPYGQIFKPFKCTCFCCARPEMLITLSSGEKVGFIRQPFNCCDPEFEIFDEQGALKYFVTADCCQCGLLCANNICGKCSMAIFIICKDRKDRTQLGAITKTPADYSEMVTSADSYQINFPQTATPKDKFLFIALGLMIDYQYFEEKASNRNNEYNRRAY